MKSLLTITALIEGATGLALAFVPSLIVSLLLGAAISERAALLVGRLAGAALITIAAACWLSRSDSQSPAMVKAALVYNVLSVTVLIYAGLVEKLSGPVLWPAVVLHVGLLVWCFSSLTGRGRKVI